jgi:hypothetical protein
LFAEIVKLGTETVTLRTVLTVREPEVPVTVALYGPGVAVLLAVRVSVLLPLVGLGARDAVTPLGRPVTERFTLPVNPYCGLTETYPVEELPWPTDTLPAESVKLGAETDKLRVVLAVREPEIPEIVRVVEPTWAVLAAVSVSVL